MLDMRIASVSLALGVHTSALGVDLEYVECCILTYLRLINNRLSACVYIRHLTALKEAVVLLPVSIASSVRQ